MEQGFTLITGASSGIGFHLAKQFAIHRHPLALVAPVQAELQQVAAELEDQHGVTARVIAKDLEQPQAADEIFDELASDGVEVDILVNNAGHGQRGKFWDVPIETDLSIVRLNVDAVLRLTKLFLQPMIQRGRGRILNVASIAGFEPGPLLAVYHASKAFVLSWSEALATELKDTNTGVSLTILCPGPTDTDFFEKADMTSTTAFQKGNLMAPQPVAEAGYKGLMDGERIVVPGAANKALVFSRRFLSSTAQAKLHEKMYSDVEPEDEKRVPHELEANEAAKDAE